MNKKLKNLLACLLTAALVFNVGVSSSFADEEASGEPTTVICVSDILMPAGTPSMIAVKHFP